jgi:hypothetical protein
VVLLASSLQHSLYKATFIANNPGLLYLDNHRANILAKIQRSAMRQLSQNVRNSLSWLGSLLPVSHHLYTYIIVNAQNIFCAFELFHFPVLW